MFGLEILLVISEYFTRGHGGFKQPGMGLGRGGGYARSLQL